MRVRPEIDPDVDDLAPAAPEITIYDEKHFVTYMRLLDAETDQADWTEVARIVLHRDPVAEAEGTRRCWESHLARARWMTKVGYRKILEQVAAEAPLRAPDRSGARDPSTGVTHRLLTQSNRGDSGA